MQDARDAQGELDAQGARAAPVERDVQGAPDVQGARTGAKPMA